LWGGGGVAPRRGNIYFLANTYLPISRIIMKMSMKSVNNFQRHNL